MNPYDTVRQFESALCDYTGAPYCVTTTSCTSAILLACAWHLRKDAPMTATMVSSLRRPDGPHIEIPKRTYVGVPMSIIHAGGRPVFRDEAWTCGYQLKPLPVHDCARHLTSGMYAGQTEIIIEGRRTPTVHMMPIGTMLCLSFHHTKHLSISTHGGAILHDNADADAWLRRARYDGRTEGVAPKDDTIQMPAWHAYMTPPTAAEGLLRLASLPKHNDPLPWGPGTASDYPDLSQMECFR